MDQKNPKWEVLLPGESPRMAHARPLRGVVGPGMVPRLPEDRDGRMLSCDLVRGVCTGCKGYHSVCVYVCVAYEHGPGDRGNVPRHSNLSPEESSGGVAEHSGMATSLQPLGALPGHVPSASAIGSSLFLLSHYGTQADTGPGAGHLRVSTGESALLPAAKSKGQR